MFRKVLSTWAAERREDFDNFLGVAETSSTATCWRMVMESYPPPSWHYGDPLLFTLGSAPKVPRLDFCLSIFERQKWGNNKTFLKEKTKGGLQLFGSCLFCFCFCCFLSFLFLLAFIEFILFHSFMNPSQSKVLCVPITRSRLLTVLIA